MDDSSFGAAGGSPVDVSDLLHGDGGESSDGGGGAAPVPYGFYAAARVRPQAAASPPALRRDAGGPPAPTYSKDSPLTQGSALRGSHSEAVDRQLQEAAVRRTLASASPGRSSHAGGPVSQAVANMNARRAASTEYIAFQKRNVGRAAASLQRALDGLRTSRMEDLVNSTPPRRRQGPFSERKVDSGTAGVRMSPVSAPRAAALLAAQADEDAPPSHSAAAAELAVLAAQVKARLEHAGEAARKLRRQAKGKSERHARRRERRKRRSHSEKRQAAASPEAALHATLPGSTPSSPVSSPHVVFPVSAPSSPRTLSPPKAAAERGHRAFATQSHHAAAAAPPVPPPVESAYEPSSEAAVDARIAELQRQLASAKAGQAASADSAREAERRLAAERQATQRRMESAQEAAASSESALAAANERARVAEVEAVHLRVAAARLEERLAATERERARAEDRATQAAASASTASEAAVSKWESRVMELEGRLQRSDAAWLAKLDTAKAQASLAAQNQAAEELSKAQAELAQLRGQLAAAKDDEGAAAKLAAAQAELAAVRQRSDAAVRAAEERAAAAHEERRQGAADLSRAHHKVSSLQDQVASLARERDALAAERDAAARARQEAATDAAQAGKEAASLRERMLASAERERELSSLLAAVRRELAETQVELGTAQEAAAEATAAASALRADNSRLAVQVAAVSPRRPRGSASSTGASTPLHTGGSVTLHSPDATGKPAQRPIDLEGSAFALDAPGDGSTEQGSSQRMSAAQQQLQRALQVAEADGDLSQVAPAAAEVQAAADALVGRAGGTGEGPKARITLPDGTVSDEADVLAVLAEVTQREQALAEEVEALRSRMAASDAARSASSSELDMAAADAATSTAALRGEIGKLVVARDEAAAEAEAAAARAAALEAELEEAREEAATQHARAEVAAAGARSAAEAAEAATQQAAESRQALAQAQQEAAEAAAASVPRSELEAVRSELHSVQAELSQVTAARAAAEESAAATRAELRQVKAEAETAADEVQRLGSRLKAAQAATEDAEGRLESATADLRRARVEAAAATEAAEVAEARTTSLTSALAQARQSTADAEGEVERHKAAATAARASGGEAATTLQLKLSSAEAAAEAAGAEAARAKAQVAELTAQLEQARAEAQAAREEAAAAKARLAEVQASMAQEGSAREAGLLAQLQEARAEADSTAQELAAVRAQRVELERQLKQARATASRHPAPAVTGLQTGRSSRAPSPPLSPASSTDRQGVLAALSATRSKSVERLRRGHSGQQGAESASGVEEVEVVDGPPTPEALGVGPLEGGGEPGRARSGAWAASSGGSEEEDERPRSARKQEAASTRKPQVVEEDLEPSEWDEWDEGSSPRPASQRRPGSGRTRSMSPRPTVTSGSKRRTGLLGGEGKVALSPHSSDEGFDDDEWFASVQEGAAAPSGAKAGRTRTPGSKRKGRGSPRPGSSAGGRSLPRSSSRHSAAGFVGGGQPGSASDCSISDSGRRTSSRWEDRPPRQARPGSRGGIMRLDWGDSKAPSDEDSAPPRSQRSGAASHSSGQGRQGGPTAYSSREAGTDLDVEEFSAGDSVGRAAPPPSAAQAWAEAGRRPDAPASPSAADLETLLGALPTTRSERPHAFEDTLSDSARSPGRRSPASTGSAGRRKGQARTSSAGEAWGRPPLRALGKASPRGGWEDDAGTPGDSGWEGSEGGRDSPQADEVSVEAVPTPYEVAAGSSMSPHAARGRAAAKRQSSPAAHPTHSTTSSDQAPPRVVANAWGAADEALSTSKAPPAWQQPSPTPSWAAPAKQGGEPGRTGPATGSDSGRSDHGVSPRSAFDATSPRLAPKAGPDAEEVVEEDLIEEELGSPTPVQPKQPQRSATPPGSPTGPSGQSRSPDVHRHYGGVEEEGGEDEAPSGAVQGATGGAVHATPSQRGAGDPGAVADTPAGPGRPARGGGSPGSPSLRRYSSTARPEVASPAAHAGGAADPVAAPAPLSSTTDAPLRTPSSGPGTPPPNLRVSQLRVPSLVDCTRAVCALSPEQRADVFHRKTVQRMEALLAGSVCIALGQGHDWAEFQRIMLRPDFPRAIQQCAQGPLPPDVEKKLKHEWNGQQMPSFLAAGSWNDPSMLVFRTLAQWVVALIQASKIARKSQGKAATPRGLPPPRAPVPATAAAAAAAGAGGGGDAPTAMPSASEDEGGRSVRDMPSASASEEEEEEEEGGGGGAEGDDAFLREAPSAAAASDAAADSDAQAVAREMAELAHFRAHMEKGLEVQKFTSKKSWLGRVFGPERRVLGIREQQAGERVVWVKDAAFTARALRDNERSLKVSDLREVRRGCDASATLRSKASPRDDDRVLSIVADSRTLDLQVADARTRTWLAHGIELLIKEHSGALPRRKAAEE